MLFRLRLSAKKKRKKERLTATTLGRLHENDDDAVLMCVLVLYQASWAAML